MENPEAKPARSGKPAHLVWRLLALMYEVLPMLALLMLCSAAILWLRAGRTVQGDPLSATAQLLLLWFVVGVYFVLSWYRGGQTMGMRPWRLQVLARDGRPAGLRALSLRYLVATASLGLGLIWCLFDKDRRSLHDLASGTLMVRLDA